MMDRGSIYDHDIPSLTASLEAFDPERSIHSTYSGRSNMHSSRWSIPPDEADSEAESEGPWAPPAWQKSNNQWLRKSHHLGESVSASRSPLAQRSHSYDERDVTPSRIPLPESPLKQTPRTSPEPLGEQEQSYIPNNMASRMQSPDQEGQEPSLGAQEGENESAVNVDGFVRFAIRGETLFRTAPLEDTISTFASGVNFFTRSRINTVSAILMIIMSWALVQPWTATLIPDVANVARMAKQYEPLLYASENIIPRSNELGEASIAVQDLSESVRASNMSASTVIIDQLDDLGESLKVLSEQMRSFFNHVDLDMDSILHAMDWTKREIQAIQGTGTGLIDTAISNIQCGLSKAGVLERNGSPTAIGKIFGHTNQQRARDTLQRTFDYLLSTLEENVSSEISRAAILFTHFESVDRRFHNLHRSVAREEDSMSTRKDEFLASLWRSNIKNKLKIKKYEKNLQLLKDVRSSTLTNKSDLNKHIQTIHSVKEQLDKARKNLISPLIRAAQSNSFGVEQQLIDMTDTYHFLKDLRTTQKHKVMQQMYGAPVRKVAFRTANGAESEIGAGEAEAS